jgi:hypothetical protein
MLLIVGVASSNEHREMIEWIDAAKQQLGDIEELELEFWA